MAPGTRARHAERGEKVSPPAPPPPRVVSRRMAVFTVMSLLGLAGCGGGDADESSPGVVLAVAGWIVRLTGTQKDRRNAYVDASTGQRHLRPASRIDFAATRAAAR